MEEEGRTSNTKYEKIDYTVTKYINVLDRWQRAVDDIRQMHHEIWANTQLNDVIIQHRTGSRVEKQTRIIERGKRTNIDFMFEVSGIRVDCDTNEQSSRFYFKPSQDSGLFGKVYASKEMIKELKIDPKFSFVFTDEVFCWDESENSFLIRPTQFRDNVMRHCGFEYKRKREISSTSPSIPGKGIVNDYDAVPCLRLKKWPKSLQKWVDSESDVFSTEWKKHLEASKNAPVFLVPTGDPTSSQCQFEFRLSFSKVEIECFSKINAHVRKLLGITKYVFQSLFGKIDILNWFHVKNLLLNTLEKNYRLKFLSTSPFQFVLESMQEIFQAVKSRRIQHFFINSCNIFPIQKFTDSTEASYTEIFHSIESKCVDLLERHVQSELKVAYNDNWFEDAKIALQEFESDTALQKYINGYLTRLLSVITFPLCREIKSIDSIIKVQDTFGGFCENKDIARLVPMVNPTILRIAGEDYLIKCRDSETQATCKEDNVSILAHVVFERMIQDGSLASITRFLPDEIGNEFTGSEIGVSISRYHRNLAAIDLPLLHVISSLEIIYGTCPRFYIHPTLFLQHIYVLHYFTFQLANDKSNAMFFKHFDKLVNISKNMSPSAPYFWKLSYRFAAMYLLNGYKKLFKDNNISFQLDFDLDSEIESFNTPPQSGCFDLK